MAQVFQFSKSDDPPLYTGHLPTSVEAKGLTCPGCGSDHLVEESAGRWLCLYCHALSAFGDSRQLVVERRLCAHCGTENPRQATTCADCNHELSPQCLKCGVQMAVWQATCPRCGTHQETYREQLAAQERERQRAEYASRQRDYPIRRDHWRRGGPGLWKLGWMVWPLMWLMGITGRWLRSGLEGLAALGINPALAAQGSGQPVMLVVGACIFSAGVVLLLASALPSIFRSS